MSGEGPYKGNPFNRLRDQGSERLGEELARAWEHARVDFTLSRLGLSGAKRSLLRKASEEGAGLLTCELFNRTYPSFPVWLACDNLRRTGGPLHTLQKAILPNWFKAFRSLPFVEAFQEVLDRLGDRAKVKPAALVFPRKGFKQGLVVHNGPLDQFVPPKSSCHVYIGGGKRRETLVVQVYYQFLDHLQASGWSHG